METTENMQQTEIQFAEELKETPRTRIRKSEQAVLNVIFLSKASGIIASEICKKLKHMPYGTVTSKFKSLEAGGHIEAIGRRKGPTGRMQTIWRHTSFGTGKRQYDYA